MRRLCLTILGLALAVPVLRATDAGTDQGKSPVQEFRELAKAFHDRMTDLGKQFDAAKTDEEKAAIREKALKDTPAEFGPKALALAKAHPKEPVTLDMLLWICSSAVQAPQVPEALDTLLRDYPAEEKLVVICEPLESRADGVELLRAFHTKVTNKTVQAIAKYFLAHALHEQEQPTREQNREAERLVAEFLELSKNMDTIPHPLVKKAEGLEWEVRFLAIGKNVPPDTEAENLAGKPAKITEYKGKVIVLDFWATWCIPCKEMIPHERELVKKNADKPFVFISVSADEKKDTLSGFLNRESMPWVHWWSGESGLVEKWNIREYPTLYVIDAKGVIRAKFVGPGNEKKLEALVEKLVQEAS
jgi:thiol-disulfide isomerase/thioredoxin